MSKPVEIQRGDDSPRSIGITISPERPRSYRLERSYRIRTPEQDAAKRDSLNVAHKNKHDHMERRGAL